MLSFALLPALLLAPSWSPEQATGAPNVPAAGDHGSAWATLTADLGPEWLELEYDKVVPIREVRIHENFNAGAITRVLVKRPDGGEEVIWQGTAPKAKGLNVFVATASPPVKGDRVRVELDTRRVSGWNEIDAVEVVGADGSRQWAARATASSSYGQISGGNGSGSMLSAMLNKEVRVRVGLETLSGRVTAHDADFIRLEGDGRVRFIPRTAISYIELDASR